MLYLKLHWSPPAPPFKINRYTKCDHRVMIKLAQVGLSVWTCVLYTFHCMAVLCVEVFQAATMPMEPEQLVWQQSAVVSDKDRFQHRRGGGGRRSFCSVLFKTKDWKEEMLTLLRKIHVKWKYTEKHLRSYKGRTQMFWLYARRYLKKYY